MSQKLPMPLTLNSESVVVNAIAMEVCPAVTVSDNMDQGLPLGRWRLHETEFSTCSLVPALSMTSTWSSLATQITNINMAKNVWPQLDLWWQYGWQNLQQQQGAQAQGWPKEAVQTVLVFPVGFIKKMSDSSSWISCCSIVRVIIAYVWAAHSGAQPARTLGCCISPS